MLPVLLAWRGIRIHSYPALLYAGMVCGLVATNYLMHADGGVDPARVLVAMLALVVVGLIGCRLLHVLCNLSFYRRYPSRLWQRSSGGVAQDGGIVAAIALSVPLLATLRVPWLAFWDIAAVALLMLWGFGKAGCLLNGCCGGRQSDSVFALYLPNHSGEWRRRLPTQLLEVGAAALILGLAAVLWMMKPPAGAVFFASTAAYAAVRIALHTTRELQENNGVQRGISLCLAGMATAGLIVTG